MRWGRHGPVLDLTEAVQPHRSRSIRQPLDPDAAPGVGMPLNDPMSHGGCCLSGEEPLSYRPPSPSFRPARLLVEQDHHPAREWLDGPDHRSDNHPGRGNCILSLADIDRVLRIQQNASTPDRRSHVHSGRHCARHRGLVRRLVGWMRATAIGGL
jgi:hypothetical protein